MDTNDGSVHTVIKESNQGFCDFKAGYSIHGSACGGKLLLVAQDEHHHKTTLEMSPVQAYEMAQQLMRAATSIQMTPTKLAC